jgi:hypothetical protein
LPTVFAGAFVSAITPKLGIDFAEFDPAHILPAAKDIADERA